MSKARWILRSQLWDCLQIGTPAGLRLVVFASSEDAETFKADCEPPLEARWRPAPLDEAFAQKLAAASGGVVRMVTPAAGSLLAAGEIVAGSQE